MDTNKSNEVCSSPNKKRTAQHPTECDLLGHTPKKNRVDPEEIDTDINQTVVKQVDKHTTAPPSSNRKFSTAYFNKAPVAVSRVHDSPSSSNRKSRDSTERKFPPFRLQLDCSKDQSVSELQIIKAINKSTKLKCTYGRFTKSKEGQNTFLLYANTNSQYEVLLNKENWPKSINNLSYVLELPNKTPASFSLVVSNVPPQWDALSFGEDLKCQYSSIIRTVRMYRNGGYPLQKVRIDFASFKEVSDLLKAKRLLVEDSNISFPVEPYIQPTRVLRCYVCQAYDDHISAHCPNRNDPICFRCAQHHPHNPKCDNPIKCPHCNGDHMAGNPNCPAKLAKRKEINALRKINNESNAASATSSANPRSSTTKSSTTAWQTTPSSNPVLSESPMNNSNVGGRNYSAEADSSTQNIMSLLDKINTSVMEVNQQQQHLSNKFESWDELLNLNQKKTQLIQHCMNDMIIPLMCEMVNLLYSKGNGSNCKKLRTHMDKLTEFAVKHLCPTVTGDYSSSQIDPQFTELSTTKSAAFNNHES
ncbi:unnamed protein product [Adineta ricciae]|uniref:Gag-like protein n=1 Tax=Adineta ricciae TaxID=249248 RepID=A0A815NXI3_ADIRI|nr:unnamed protein product [Adineta ricciae]CAF1469129.1 unnamed protein product [Adineta ricciae]